MQATALDIASELRERGFCHVSIWEHAPEVLHDVLRQLKAAGEAFAECPKAKAIERGEYKDRLRKWWIARLIDYDLRDPIEGKECPESMPAGSPLSKVGLLPFMAQPVKDFLGVDELLYHPGCFSGLPPQKHPEIGSGVYHMPNLWWIPPHRAQEERNWSENWHCDPESSRLVKVFWWLRDVDEESGPMQVSSTKAKPMAYLKPGFEHHLQNITTFTVPADTLTFVDTSRFHRGGYTGSKGRLCMQWCYFVREA